MNGKSYKNIPKRVLIVKKMDKTAVDWLVEQLQAPCRGIPSHILEQAKAMEKEQIEEAWNDGNLLGRNGNVILEYTTGKEYYKETYKQ